MTFETEKCKEKIILFINGERHEIYPCKITVGEIINLGGGKPGEYELQKRDGRGGPVAETYSDPAQVIEVMDKDYFTTRFTGPINPAAGDTISPFLTFDEFLNRKRIKYERKSVEGKYLYVFDHVIPNGKYAGKIVTIALPIPTDFPVTAPYGFHVKMNHEFAGDIPNVNSSPIESGWQFWSREVNNWDTSHRSAQYYFDHVNRWLELN